jgi:hypothetical protein
LTRDVTIDYASRKQHFHEATRNGSTADRASSRCALQTASGRAAEELQPQGGVMIDWHGLLPFREENDNPASELLLVVCFLAGLAIAVLLPLPNNP